MQHFFVLQVYYAVNGISFIFQVSEELAQKLGREDADRLLKDKKLVLLVDLDQTLVHTTNDNVPPNLKVIKEVFGLFTVIIYLLL